MPVFGQRYVGVSAVEGDDRFAERPVSDLPPAWESWSRHERLAHDGVGEGEAPRTGLDQETGVHGFIEAIDDRVRRRRCPALR